MNPHDTMVNGHVSGPDGEEKSASKKITPKTALSANPQPAALPPVGYISKSQPPHSFDPRIINRKKVLVMIGVVAVLVVVGAYVLTKPKKTGPVVSNEISITSKGLIPAEASVKVNTQVTWVNDDKKVHDIAADPYPADNSIPDFDSNILLEPDDSLTFIFAAPGTYTYHDQINPGSSRYYGAVIVHP